MKVFGSSCLLNVDMLMVSAKVCEIGNQKIDGYLWQRSLFLWFLYCIPVICPLWTQVRSLHAVCAVSCSKWPSQQDWLDILHSCQSLHCGIHPMCWTALDRWQPGDSQSLAHRHQVSPAALARLARTEPCSVTAPINQSRSSTCHLWQTSTRLLVRAHQPLMYDTQLIHASSHLSLSFNQAPNGDTLMDDCHDIDAASISPACPAPWCPHCSSDFTVHLQNKLYSAT